MRNSLSIKKYVIQAVTNGGKGQLYKREMRAQIEICAYKSKEALYFMHYLRHKCSQVRCKETSFSTTAPLT
ncbi:hypothetical protein KSZ_69660 [Dictyobacter formicarum]|uniref:Uncharacterized protein n=1 Tax=Dictyobacter formicarum TaxID=2778368 RepID=A0ABQ3VS05_9CHLR|nr:hypothetical protein KSZ_69660 [Dictyobacter formicarum]